MNYRHIYHAGNLCDVVKHITLLALLAALRRKATPFMVLDTHAGCGLYALAAPEALKTAEADSGVRRWLRCPQALQLLPYVQALAAYNPALWQPAAAVSPAAAPTLLRLLAPEQLLLYPGSPSLIMGALRPQDRYIGCELHPADFATLRQTLRQTLPAHARQHPPAAAPRCQLHQRDGYALLLASLPPPEKRGLVLLDPPYERGDEFERITATLQAAHQRWRQGVYAVWYPLKERSAVAQWLGSMVATGIQKQLRLEFNFADPASGGLYGSGLLLINPPWGVDAELRTAYALLQQGLNAPSVPPPLLEWLVPE
jgi:23S rRNA (adenine2030-N6)-methyltransferase